MILFNKLIQEPFLPKMTESELFAVMVAAFSTVKKNHKLFKILKSNTKLNQLFFKVSGSVLAGWPYKYISQNHSEWFLL